MSLAGAPAVSNASATRAVSEDQEVTEMIVPVEWEVAVPLEEANKEPGMFASQVTACNPRDERTIEVDEREVGNGNAEVS